MGLNEELIQLGIRKLKKETDLKRIAKLRKNLNKSGLSDEEIDRRLNALSLDEQSPTQESENPTQLSPQNIGYKKPHILVGDQMYVLACTHQIRSRKQIGIFSRGMIGKKVWCEICSAEREVTAMPFWIR